MPAALRNRFRTDLPVRRFSANYTAKGTSVARGGGSGSAPYWQWFESFNTDDAAAIAATAPANPGPGTSSFTGSTAAIAGGQYVEDVGASAAGVFFATAATSRIGAACVAYGFNWSRVTTSWDCGFSASAGFGASSMRPGLSANTANLNQSDGTTSQVVGGVIITTGSAWDLCTISDTIGGFTFYKLSSAALWTLAGLTRFDTTAAIFARLRTTNAAATLNAIGLAAGVPRPVGHPVLASGVQGTYTLPTANFMLGIRLTGTGDNGVKFRIVDATNFFRAERTNAGALRIVRVDAGADTVVSTSAMTAAANDRIYLRLEGNVCRISGHPTGGTWVNPSTGTLTQHTTGLGVAVMDEAAYDSLEIYPLTHYLYLPDAI